MSDAPNLATAVQDELRKIRAERDAFVKALAVKIGSHTLAGIAGAVLTFIVQHVL